MPVISIVHDCISMEGGKVIMLCFDKFSGDVWQFTGKKITPESIALLPPDTLCRCLCQLGRNINGATEYTNKKQEQCNEAYCGDMSEEIRRQNADARRMLGS